MLIFQHFSLRAVEIPCSVELSMKKSFITSEQGHQQLSIVFLMTWFTPFTILWHLTP